MPPCLSVTFLRIVIKYLTKSNFMEKGLTLVYCSQQWGQSWWGRHPCGRTGLIYGTQRKTVSDSCCFACFFISPFFRSGIQTHGIMLLTFNVGFPSITNPFWKHLHRNSEMCLLGDFRCSQVTSNDNHTPCPAQSVYFLSCFVSTFKMYL